MIVLAVTAVVYALRHAMYMRLAEVSFFADLFGLLVSCSGEDEMRRAARAIGELPLEESDLLMLFLTGRTLSAAFDESSHPYLAEGERALISRIAAALDLGDADAVQKGREELSAAYKELSVSIPRDVKLILTLSACAVAALILLII